MINLNNLKNKISCKIDKSESQKSKPINKRHNPSQVKKMYNKTQNLFQNEIKQIKRKIKI